MKFHYIIPFLATASLSSALPQPQPQAQEIDPLLFPSLPDNIDPSIIYSNLAGLIEAGLLYLGYTTYQGWKHSIGSQAVGEYAMLRESHETEITGPNGNPVEVRITQVPAEKKDGSGDERKNGEKDGEKEKPDGADD